MLSCIQLFVTLWTVAHQASLSLGFFSQEYWSGLPFSPLGDLPNPGFELTFVAFLALQADSLLLCHQGGPMDNKQANTQNSKGCSKGRIHLTDPCSISTPPILQVRKLRLPRFHSPERATLARDPGSYNSKLCSCWPSVASLSSECSVLSLLHSKTALTVRRKSPVVMN